MKQTVATTPGTQYVLVWYVGNISGGNFGTASVVKVLVNDQEVVNATNSTPGTTMAWQQFSYPFTPGSASTTIEFRNVDPANDASNGLDDISLVTAASLTPPPDTKAPSGKLSGPASQTVGSSVSTTVACLDEACTAAVSGKVTTSYKTPNAKGAAAKTVKKSFRLKAVTKPIAAGGQATFKLKLSRKARKAIKKALRRGGKASAKLTVKLSDAVGNSATLKRSVKFKL